MSNKILIDFSQIALACVFQFKDELRKNQDKIQGLLYHVILQTIIAHKKKLKGDIVLAVEGRKNWRKEYFPFYKANRAKNREADDFPWDKVFPIINELVDEIDSKFPWKVVKVDESESNDIIAVVTKYHQESMLEYSDISIVSSDHDYYQLHSYPGVKQFCPQKKKLIKIEKSKVPELIVDIS